MKTLAILGYHKIGPPPPGGWETWSYVPEDVFRGHLQSLARQGWQMLHPREVTEGLQSPDALPDRGALITFDDGYRSLREGALRALRRMACPSVLFVPTAYIGGDNTFDADNEPKERMCDWDDLRALEAEGMSVQSHGVSHRRFSTLSAAEQDEELRRSKEVLETGLRKTVDLFAFPYGDDGHQPERLHAVLAGLGYRAACLYGGGPVVLPPDGPYRLERLAMGPDTDLEAMLHGA